MVFFIGLATLVVYGMTDTLGDQVVKVSSDGGSKQHLANISSTPFDEEEEEEGDAGEKEGGDRNESDEESEEGDASGKEGGDRNEM